MNLISTREIDRYSKANDASHYLLTPVAIATPNTIEDVAKILSSHHASGTPVTFRSGGTSLSGQSLSKSVLIDTRMNFKRCEIKDSGRRVTVEPGVSIREVNNRLKSYGYRFGPDPASEVVATIGGVIANNSSGMVCGTSENAYKTIESLKMIFADGTSLDTAAPDAERMLQQLQPLLFEELLTQKRIIEHKPKMQEDIKLQFQGKNTMGYSINAFLDYSSPIDILMHLMVGSEGTLAFISEATFRTIPLKPFASTSLLIFGSLQEANSALPALVESKAAAIELLDQTSLRVAQKQDRALDSMRNLKVEKHAALIVEYQEYTSDGLAAARLKSEEIMAKLNLSIPSVTTSDNFLRSDLWHVRKGLYASVAEARSPGTTALLEDVAVPVNLLAQTCEDLLSLFNKFGYLETVIFGHAKDGNLHFMLNEDFREIKSQNRYRDFTEEMVSLILGYKGTLKAEHGTGRVMAPFVQRQYGDDLYGVMVSIKRAFDPRGILNPDVIITKDSQLHLRDFKVTPPVEVEVNNCVECGFCEQSCPSKNLTLTPRQRIIARRAIQNATLEGNDRLARKLDSAFSYEGIDSCAVDGMCKTSCPVGINTGDLVKRLRGERSSVVERYIWKSLAKHWAPSLMLIRAGVLIAGHLPIIAKMVGKAGRFMFGAERVPLVDDLRIQIGKKRFSRVTPKPDLIYLPSCINEIFGPSNVHDFLELCLRAGLNPLVPEGIESTCCGTPWRSKGMSQGLRLNSARNQNLANLIACYNLPVVTDNSSCADGFLSSLSPLIVFDSSEYLLGTVVDRLQIVKADKIVVHPTCSSTKLDDSGFLLGLAHRLANEVIVAPNWGCCAFAGDRGLLHPELTKSATFEEAEFIKKVHADFYISDNRTCEMAMSNAVGVEYISAIKLLLMRSS